MADRFPELSESDYKDFKSLKIVNLFLKFFSLIDVYILLLNGWLYVQFEVDRINCLTEKETNWFLSKSKANDYG